MQTIFIIGFYSRRNMQLSILGYTYVPFYSSIPNLLGFIYSPLFFLFLIIGYICRPYCVLWFGSLGHICDPLPHFHGPRVLRRKISVAHWGYGDW